MRIVLEKGFNWKFRRVFACFREPGLWVESPHHLGPLVEEGVKRQTLRHPLLQ